MADNAPYPAVSGTSMTIAADDIGGVLHQRVKVVVGADGTSLGDVGPTNPLPVAVSGPVQISGTVTAGAGTTVISGTVSVNGPVQISGTVTAGAGTTVVSLTGTAQVSGTVSVSGAVAMSGTGLVSVVPGVSVVAQVSGTVSAADPNQLYTTAAPAAASTGLIVISKGGHSVTVQQGVSVSAVVSGTVTVNGSVSVSGTAVVSVVPGLSVSAVVSGSVAVSGTALVSIVAGASVSILNVVNSIVTVLGTQIVSVVPGLSVSAVVSGTVSIGTPLSTVIYTTAQASGSTGMLVYLAASQTMNLTVTVTNTVTITATDVARTAIFMVVTSTVLPAGSTVLFTVYQGAAQTVAGVTVWVVPAGKTFRVLNVQMDMVNSITTTPASLEIAVLVSGATPTWTSACPRVAGLKLRCPNATAPRADFVGDMAQDVAAGVTVAIGVSAATATATLVQGQVIGYLYP